MALDITPGDYFRIVMASGVAATLVTTAINSWTVWRQKRADAIPLLLEAANALDGYAFKCDQMLELSYRVERECGETQSYDPLSRVSIPTFVYPEGMPWGTLNKRIISALKGLPIMIDASKVRVKDAYREEPVPTDALPEEQSEIAKLGLHSLDLSMQLRTDKGLPLELHQLEAVVRTRAALEGALQNHAMLQARIEASNIARNNKMNSILEESRGGQPPSLKPPQPF